MESLTELILRKVGVAHKKYSRKVPIMAKNPSGLQDNGVVKDASTPLNDSLVVGGGVVLGASSAGNTTGSDSTPALRAEAGETVVRGTWLAVLQDGKTVYQSGTTIIDGRISLSDGASLHVTSGAVASAVDTTARGIARVYVQSGGVLVSSYIENGFVTISDGGITSANRLNSDPVYISSGGTSIDDVMYASGFGSDPTYVYSGGVVINPILNSGGRIYGSGGTISGGVVGSGGYIWTNDDTTTSGITVSGGGSANLSGNVEGGGPSHRHPPPPAVREHSPAPGQRVTSTVSRFTKVGMKRSAVVSGLADAHP